MAAEPPPDDVALSPASDAGDERRGDVDIDARVVRIVTSCDRWSKHRTYKLSSRITSNYGSDGKWV